MRIVSTQLQMNDDYTVEQFFSTAIGWLKGNNPSKGVGERLEQNSDKTNVREVDAYCLLETISAEKDNAQYQMVRLAQIFHEQLWTTEVILENRSGQKYVFIHVDCQGDITRFNNVPEQRSASIRAFVNGGYLKQEPLPLMCCPIEATDRITPLLVGAIKGDYDLLYPLVYVSKIRNTAGYEVDPDRLAYLLGGLAYVVKETDDDYSFELKDKTGGGNPYGGSIGIYYMGGRSKVYRANEIKYPSTEKAIAGEVIRAITAHVGSTAPTWDELYMNRLEQEIRESEKFINETIDANETLEEKLKSAKERIRQLVAENMQLSAKNESLLCALTARNQENIIAPSETEEWYDGEQHDLIVTIMQKAVRDYSTDTRAYELLSDLLTVNSIRGEGQEIFRRLKAILSKGENLTDRDFRELQELGFIVTSDANHYRLTFKGAEPYKFTLPKTPSDHREGKNSVSDITKRLSIYR